MKKLIALILLLSFALAYIAVPDMNTPDYPEGTEFYQYSLLKKETHVEFQDFAGHGVKQITIYPSNQSAHVKAVVSPVTVVGVPGQVYKGMNIQVKNLVGSVNVIFAVSKNWLTNNSIPETEITLYHLESVEWTEKSLTISDATDPSYVFYTAALSSFSSYALSTKVEAPPEVPQNNTPTNGTVNGEPQDNESSLTIELIIIGILVFILILIIVLYIYKEQILNLFKKSEQEHQS